MPTQPSPWYSGPLSPQQLNLATYSYDGSGFGATGILFHSHRSILSESMTQCRALTVSSAGTWNIFQGSNTTAFAIFDNSSLFGGAAEYPGVFALYHFVPQLLAGNGIGGTDPSLTTGGNYLAAHFATAAAAGATPAAIGSGVYWQPNNGTASFWAQGAVQAHGTGHAGESFYIDLVNPGTHVNTWLPAGFYADASLTTETPAASSTDTAGFTPRDLWIWAGVTAGGTTVSQVPTPQASWTAPVTSALMNGPSGPVQALSLLNNPPMLRVSQALTTSISTGTATTVPFTVAGTIDTYSAFNSPSSTYVAPLAGLYLAFPTIAFAPNSSGARYAGLQIQSGGTGSTVSQTFSTAGTISWTAPSGVTSLQVQCWGGGGGGGAEGTVNSGGGGGGGEYALQTVTVTPGHTYSLVVGAGGIGAGTASSANGAGGGISSFTADVATVLANGGGGGAGTAPTGINPGGAGGTGSTNTTHYSGGAGAGGTATTSGGGGSSAGTAAAGNAASGSTGASAPTGGGAGGSGGTSGGAGSAGSQPGGGGGGGSA